MTNVLELKYNNLPMRTVFQDDEPWWALVDLCGILELTNPAVVASQLDDDEKAKFNLGLRGRDPWFVNEPGLYHVILTSRSERAKPFRRHVTHEILPAIRKQGFYSTLTDEKLIEILTDRQRQNPKFLESIDKQAIKSKVLHEKRSDAEIQCSLLFLERSKYSRDEYRAKLKKICDGDQTLFRKEWEWYAS